MEFKIDEISKHCHEDDLWLIIDGKVYDMTVYLQSHPGGGAILRNAGGEASQGFHAVKAHRTVKGLIADILQKHWIGDVKASSRALYTRP